MHETTISPVGGQGKTNKKGKPIPLYGKLQISNAKLIPAIGRKCKVTIEYEETLAGVDAPVEPQQANPPRYDAEQQTKWNEAKKQITEESSANYPQSDSLEDIQPQTIKEIIGVQ